MTMRILGLTGGIGSGKSEVGRHLETHGIPVINADNIGHEMLEPTHPMAQQVVAAFGPNILENGKISRRKLGAIVFADKGELVRLNTIMHPELKHEIRKRCAKLENEGHKVVVVDAAILGENGTLDSWLDGLILILSDAEIRVKRLVETRGMSVEDAQARIAAQWPPEKKRPLATHILENNSSLKELHDCVDKLIEDL